jgi:hypothetical protein
VNVTTLPATGAPFLSIAVAVRRVGLPVETAAVEVLSETLVRDKVREPALVVVVFVPVPVAVFSPLPHPLRQQNRVKKISSSIVRENFALVDFTILFSFF